MTSATARRVEYDSYLQTPEWQARRRVALKQANYRCQLCNSGKRLHVHHRTYQRLGSEWPEDLTVLCENCHVHFHKITKPKIEKKRRSAGIPKTPRHLRSLPRQAGTPRLEAKGDHAVVLEAISKLGAGPYTAGYVHLELRKRDRKKITLNMTTRSLEWLQRNGYVELIGVSGWRKAKAP